MCELNRLFVFDKKKGTKKKCCFIKKHCHCDPRMLNSLSRSCYHQKVVQEKKKICILLSFLKKRLLLDTFINLKDTNFTYFWFIFTFFRNLFVLDTYTYFLFCFVVGEDC